MIPAVVVGLNRAMVLGLEYQLLEAVGGILENKGLLWGDSKAGRWQKQQKTLALPAFLQKSC
jgi:hypothetical protein